MTESEPLAVPGAAAGERRGTLRRAEDCVALLEAAMSLGATEVTAGVAAQLGGRLPLVRVGTPIAEALAAARTSRDAQPSGRERPDERRVLHRRPAFDHQVLLQDLFPWRP